MKTTISTNRFSLFRTVFPVSFSRILFLILLSASLSCSTANHAVRSSDLQSQAPPLIGISIASNDEDSKHSVPSAYAKAVIEAGGIPLYLPITRDEAVLERYVELVDGLVLSGGGDVPPRAYGEKPDPSVSLMSEARWECERRLIALWLEGDKPLLGVCLGSQFTNVVSGGSLIQDIPSMVGKEVVHRTKVGASHPIAIEPGSMLDELIGPERLVVNSFHHQAVKRVGRNLRVIARADDGVVEGMVMSSKRWGLFVQWHPERMASREHRTAVYGALVRACKAYKSGK